MTKQAHTPPKGPRADQAALHKALSALAASGVLDDRLRQLDRDRAVQRIYIMGCGRSGTWLLTALMSTLAGAHLVAKELPVEYFGVLSPPESTLILKRNLFAFESIERIPGAIHILYIVRHPFDVLTSVNPVHPKGPGVYYISPARWLGEMLALQYLVDTERPNTLVLRYEDLVQDPDRVQQLVARQFGLQIRAAAGDAHTVFAAPPEAQLAMHGLRQIDRQSLDKYKRSEPKKAYLRSIRPRLGRMLDWVGQTYRYDTSL